MATSVATFAELKSAIEDNSTTDILVTQDITFASGGAKVNLAKSVLNIDFGGHTITDNNTLTFTDTIYVSSTTNTISVTAKNAVWSGRNYYGVIGVYNGDVNTTINLENIKYTGPQFVYNKNGITNIKNCTIELTKNESSANPQEFCEANRVNISGDVTVNSGSTSDAVIWFTGTNAALTVEESANFKVTAGSTYFLYTDVSPALLFKQNSNTTIATKSGLFYAASSSAHIAASFTLEENASFVATKYVSNTVPMFKCISNFSLGKNSTFQLYSEIISSAALMYFGQQANINIDSPRSVVLYNRGGNAFSFQTGSAASPNIININAEMLRLWDVAKYPVDSAGGFDNAPTSEYYKANYSENVTMNIKASSSQLLEVESNLTDGDVGYPVSAAGLKLITSKVVSMGTLALDVEPITDLDDQIAGRTEADANVKIEYDSRSLTIAADEYGNFNLPLSSSLAVGTTVNVAANKQFLTKSLEILTEGSVSIAKVDDLKFHTFTTQSNLNVVFRENKDFGITVLDTRTSGGNWFLYALINQPLTSGTDKLENALVFKQSDATSTIGSDPLLVHTGSWKADSKETTVTWDEIEGFLLNIDPAKEYAAGEYSTDLIWEVSTAEL